jgi:lactate dehydrogenase-like 2-hydroxyacid dehydrogenase
MLRESHRQESPMSKPEILMLDRYPDWDEGPLAQDYTLHHLPPEPDRAGFLQTVGPRIRGILTSGGRGAPSDLIAALPALEVISIYGVGYDRIDLDLCRSRGVRVANTPDVLTGDVADLCVGMILALNRGMVGADAWVRSGDWAARGAYPLQRRVHGRRVGVLGLGRIGAAIARRLAAFDMAVSYSARAPKEVPAGWAWVPDPVDLARQSDVLVVALAATAATRHIVGREVIAAMGPDGVIVNISRAANIDEEALLHALESGALHGAALDVFEDEPRLNPRFAALPNVVLQPHQASATVETRRAMGQMMRDNLAAHFAGKPLPGPVV